jgi:hypothetical protein
MYAVTGQQGGLAGCKPAKNPFSRRRSGGAKGFSGSVASLTSHLRKTCQIANFQKKLLTKGI